MRPVSSRFAVAVPLGLLLALVIGSKNPPRVVAAEPEAPGAAKSTPYDHTAIGLVLKANYGRAPRNGSELMRVLKKVGDFAQLPVPFSAVNLASSLTTPRVIIAPRPGGKVLDPDADTPAQGKDKLSVVG